MSIAERDTTVRARRTPPSTPPPRTSSPRASPLRMAIDVRGTALTVLATAAAIAFLWWAQAFFIPVLLAVLISHALEPVVCVLERSRCPRWLAVFVVLGGVVVGVGYGVYALGEPVSTFIDQMPSQARRLRVALENTTRKGTGAIDRVKQAANEIERAATTAAAPPPTPAGVQRVRIVEPPFRLGDLLWRGSRGLIEFLASAVVVFFLTYYLMLAGDLYRRRLASIAGPSFGRRRRALRILLAVDDQIRRYLIARFVISLAVFAATWGAMAAIGLNQSLMWGVISGILNVVPYVGPVTAIVAVTLAAFAQFGALAQTALVWAAASLIAFLEGNVLTPRLTSRAGGMNAISVFAGILFWGWLWGVWGMLLAVPILTATKAICAQIDQLRPIAALLSEG